MAADRVAGQGGTSNGGGRGARADDAIPGQGRAARYCSRPTFALERLSILPYGRVAYEVKYPRGEKTRRIMDPLEFMARLAALVAPPRHPLMHNHGVLALHCKRRASVVPRPRTEPAQPANAG